MLIREQLPSSGGIEERKGGKGRRGRRREREEYGERRRGRGEESASVNPVPSLSVEKG